MNLSSAGNNLNLLRLLAAVAVVVSHSFLLTTGAEQSQPLGRWFSHNLGQLAVIVFFFISGLTISASLARNPRPADFLAARILRIWPELVVCLVLVVFVLGPLLATGGPAGYFADPGVWAYFAKAFVLFGGRGTIDGLFAANPAGPSVNEPLWTLKFEFACYLGLLALSAAGLFADRRRFMTVCVAYAVIATIALAILPGTPTPRGTLLHVIDFSLAFMLGAAAYHFHRHLQVGPVLAGAALLLIVLVRDTWLEHLFIGPVVGVEVIALASIPMAGLRAWTAENDLSYGTYIYGWPVAQAIVQLVPGIGWAPLLVAGLAIVAVLAYGSWRFVGRPARHLKAMLLGSIGRRTPERAPPPCPAATPD